jgi:1,4-dihydroxy-2-naphthoate octaprenyltransferase
MITTANFNRDRVQIKTVITARKAYPRYPLFRVLSSPAGKPTLPAGLVGMAVGISKNTIGGQTSVWILLPCLSLPLAIHLNRIVWKTQGGSALNQTLAETAKLTLIFSVLLSIGLALP